MAKAAGLRGLTRAPRSAPLDRISKDLAGPSPGCNPGGHLVIYPSAKRGMALRHTGLRAIGWKPTKRGDVMMMGRTWIHGVTIACVLCLLAGPTTHALSAGLEGGLSGLTRPSKADKLAKEAEGILAGGEIHEWAKGARLLERAAFLRDDVDEAKPANLKLAGTLYYAVGLREHARDRLEQAALIALHQGDLVDAAYTYLDAAALSAQLKMGRHTINAAREARRTAASPEAAETDGAAILDRVEHLGAPPALAQIM